MIAMKTEPSHESPREQRARRPAAWRILGLALLTFGAMTTTVGLFYAEENWRGKHEWETYKRQIEARGVSLDWHKDIPPPVPDDQNFAMTPFLAPLYDYIRPRNGDTDFLPYRDTNGVSRAECFAQDFDLNYDFRDFFAEQGHLTSLNQWVSILRNPAQPIQPNSTPPPAQLTRKEAAAAVLSELNQFKPVLDELRTASSRPYSRFNVYYDTPNPLNIVVPHYFVLQRLSGVLEVRASAKLALGDSRGAFEDVCLMFALAEADHSDPFFWTQSARVPLLCGCRQIIWEGLAQGLWSEPQLLAFETRLTKIALIKDVVAGLECDRGRNVQFFEFIRKQPGALDWMLRETAFGTNQYIPVPLFVRVAPSGWLYHKQIESDRTYDEKVLPAFDAQGGRIHPRMIDALVNPSRQQAEGSFNRFWQQEIIEKFLQPWNRPWEKWPLLRFAFGQTSVDEAAVACALERYRLANGNFPEKAQELVPGYIDKLPDDVCNGKPLEYRRIDDSHFILYSVGWNETDDGGRVVMNSDGKTVNPTQGDWVWQYPESN